MRSKRLILLDIDGVLNPAVRPSLGGVQGPYLVLSQAMVQRVNALAKLGRVAWASTWQLDQTVGLETQLALDGETLRVPLSARALDLSTEPTPKLRLVSRWLSRTAAEGERWTAIVWIDDGLGSDAQEWALQNPLPTFLVRPSPSTGLLDVHVRSVEAFFRGVAGG